MVTEKLTVDVFSDIACPWCYIGEARLHQALSRMPDLDIVWRWRPFQLQPQLPDDGVAWDDFVTERFGGAERADPAFQQVAAVGSEDGLEFRFDRIQRAPNTRAAHRLILLASEYGAGRPVANALFRAHFTEGRDVSDRETLLSVAVDAGFDRSVVASFLDGDDGEEVVRQSQRDAAELGITGVPFYVVGERLAVSGAQTVEVFERVLREGGDATD